MNPDSSQSNRTLSSPRTRWGRGRLGLVLGICASFCLSALAVAGSPAGAATPTADPAGWTLSWADEFNTPSVRPDAAKWGYDIGGGGYGNSELEYYTDRTPVSYTHLTLPTKRIV